MSEDRRGEPDSIFAPALRITTVGLLVVITIVAFEAMAVGAALPTAARDLHGLGAYGWAFTGFLAAAIVGTVAGGQVCDLRGPRPSLVVGLVGFTAGLALSGTATTMAQLVAGRVVQGASGGFLITAVYVVIGQRYSDRLRPRVFTATSSAWVLPSLVGPAASGFLAQHVSWRWAFLGLLPFIVLGVVLLLPVLRTLHRPEAGTSPDRTRTLVHACALAAGVAALEQAGQHPSPVTLAAGSVGLALVCWGLLRLLPPGTTRVRPGVPAPIALRGLLAGAFFGIEATVPLSLTVQHHYGATAAGLPLTVAGFSWSIGSWIQGRVDDARRPRARISVIRAGFACVVGAAIGMTVAVQPAVPGWLAYPAWLLAGLGAGLTMSSSSVLLLKFTTADRRGADSAALQLSDATANAITTGVAGVLIAAAVRGAIGFTSGFVAMDLAMGAVAVLGVLTAGRARPAAPPRTGVSTVSAAAVAAPGGAGDGAAVPVSRSATAARP